MSKEEDQLSDPELIDTVKKITGFTPIELVNGLRDKIKNASLEERFMMAARTPSLAGVIYKMNEAEAHRRVEAEKNPSITRRVAQPTVMQGGIIYRSFQGLHTPTMEEIIQKANKPDPTAPYFDPNSDFGRMIDPMEPHWSGGEYSQFIDPRKPSPKIGGPA